MSRIDAIAENGAVVIYNSRNLMSRIDNITPIYDANIYNSRNLMSRIDLQLSIC